MKKRITSSIMLASLLFGCVAAIAAEQDPQFAKLDSKQIRARFPGKELTDEVHYAYRFDRNGRIAMIDLGKSSQGKWRIVKDTLCLVLDQPAEQTEENCYQVWMAGKHVELRAGDDLPVLPIEGILQRPEARQ